MSAPTEASTPILGPAECFAPCVGYPGDGSAIMAVPI